MYRRAFTLIELLVVISIIALLSSVVLTSLNSARTKSKNTAVKGALAQLRTQINIYENDNNGLGAGSASTCNGGFFANSKINEILLNAVANSGYPTIAFGNVDCNYVSPNLWAVQIYLSPLTIPPAGTELVACVDSRGFLKEQARVNNANQCTP